MTGITLTPDEIEALTGYRRPADQLAALLRRGFFRAHMGPQGVIVERAHYEAVCAGQAAEAPKTIRVPKAWNKVAA